MDLNTVTEFTPATTAAWRDGDAWLGGGTWLFSQPQPSVRRLLDLASFGWTPLAETGDGLEIAATCTLGELRRWRPRSDRARTWPATALAARCCDALLASFKVQHVATVGGNICLSLPAGPMTSLSAALDGVATLVAPSGAVRALPVAEFVTGNGSNLLAPGELLRSVFLPASALGCRAAFRQVSLSAVGRSAAVVIARVAPDSGVTVVTVTAAVARPLVLRFDVPPTPASAVGALDAACPAYLDDIHGARPWRAAMTRRAVAEAVAEAVADVAVAGAGSTGSAGSAGVPGAGAGG
jgi:CO/xanthine dehydrogenase FAD-binding subunit